MAICNLNKYENYNLDNVKHDLTENQFVVKLSRPPSTCKEGVFTSHAAILKVDSNLAAPILSYDGASNKPVVLVPNETVVQNVNIPQGHFWGITLGLAAVVGLFFLIRWLMNEKSEEPASEHVNTSGVRSSRYQSSTPNLSNTPKSDWSEVSEPAAVAAAPKAPAPRSSAPSPTHHEPHTTATVQQTILMTGGGGGSSPSDMLTGMALGSVIGAASRNDDYEERQSLRRREAKLEEEEAENRRERRVEEERQSRQATAAADEEDEDDSKASSDSSNDSSDSYSSDSGSDSFSSDSGSDSFSND